jgi:predicted nucleic acid-binding protein
VILADTSALYALASDLDPDHRRAVSLATAIERSGVEILVHGYVLCETFALVHRRRGLEAALRMDAFARGFTAVPVDPPLHDRAVERLRSGTLRRLSLVDAVSFEVMEARGIDAAFAFDPDFEKAGFRLYDGR